MRKLIALTLSVALCAAMFTGCGKKQPASTQTTPTPTQQATQPSTQSGVKMGLGHKVDVSKSVNAAADKNGQAQVNTVMAAVTVDANGKILSVKIDNAQTKVDFDAKGVIKTDLKALQDTKVELADKYGMKKSSKIGKEWFEQIAALEKWMTGKTVADIKAMKVKKVDDAHTSVPDIEDLKSSVTISVEDYQAAVEEAVKNAQPVSGTVAKVGLGHKVDVSKSVNAAADKNGQAQVNTVMTVTAFDASGKILATTIDNAQTKVDFDAKGAIKTDLKALQDTKVELGDKYGMKKSSKIGKEWFEQIAALDKWMVGKTVADVKAMKVKKVDDSHTSVPDVEDLKSSVTISVEDYQAVVEEASKNAK